MTVKTVPFDAAEFLDTEESQQELIADAMQTGDRAYILNALNTVARARGMSAVAEQAGVTRDTLYKALSESGDPKLSTVLGLIKALGFSLSATSSQKKSAQMMPSTAPRKPGSPRKAKASTRRAVTAS